MLDLVAVNQAIAKHVTFAVSEYKMNSMVVDIWILKLIPGLIRLTKEN